jgi:hypothetical protein
MKAFTVLCAFSHNDVLGASVLAVDKVLPLSEITDESENSLDAARTLCHIYMGIDKQWPLEYNQVGTFEEKVGEEKHLYIVYSLYFPDINATRLNAFWKKISDIAELETFHQNMVRYTAIKRY